MRHQKAFHKLGRNPSHRRALLRNMATSLVLHERIETTLPKAKALRRVADKLVTLGKKNSLHARRQAMGFLFAQDREEKGISTKLTPVHKLFTEIAPRYAERNGGYTRVVRTRRRDGDRAQMAIIEFVEKEFEKKQKRRKRRAVRKVSEPLEAAAEAPVASEELTESTEESASPEGEEAVLEEGDEAVVAPSQKEKSE